MSPSQRINHRKSTVPHESSHLSLVHHVTIK
jgi:hypothetical protein